MYTMTIDTMTDQQILDGLLDGSLTELTDNNVVKVAQYALASHAGLQTLRLLNATTIYTNGCTSMSNLKLLVLPKLTTIASASLTNLSKLETIIIPSISNIGSSTHYCNNDNVTVMIIGTAINTVCSIASAACISSKIKNGNGYVYVPDALLTGYQTATNWSTYSSQIKGISALQTDNPTLWAEYQNAMAYV